MKIDIFGKAITDYYLKNDPQDILVKAMDFDDDRIPVAYLFRGYEEMPKLEQKALQLANGRILDVGCGAGSHAQYLQEKGLDVTGIDTSEGAIKIAKARGVKNANVQDFYSIQKEQYDTVLLLMNGSGIAGTMNNLPAFFKQLKSVLKSGGQILVDSSDLSYLFEDTDGGFWVDTNKTYYGEMRYQLTYKNQSEDWFDWLYLDYSTLDKVATENHWHCELLLEGNHYDYLARLTSL